MKAFTVWHDTADAACIEMYGAVRKYKAAQYRNISTSTESHAATGHIDN